MISRRVSAQFWVLSTHHVALKYWAGCQCGSELSYQLAPQTITGVPTSFNYISNAHLGF